MFPLGFYTIIIHFEPLHCNTHTFRLTMSQLFWMDLVLLLRLSLGVFTCIWMIFYYVHGTLPCRIFYVHEIFSQVKMLKMVFSCVIFSWVIRFDEHIDPKMVPILNSMYFVNICFKYVLLLFFCRLRMSFIVIESCCPLIHWFRDAYFEDDDTTPCGREELNLAFGKHEHSAMWS